MELNAAGIKEQPFRTHGDPLYFVAFQAQADAERFLHNVCKHPHGLGLFQGPSLSGKTTILRHFAETLDEDRTVAIVNGSCRDPGVLLDSILCQFGFSVKLDSVNEQLNMLRVYVTQQASCHSAPLLIIENTHTLNPDELQILCSLADMRTRHQYALRLVLSSDRSIAPIVNAPAMECIGKRLTGDFHLAPMEDYETLTYLHAKLRAGRCDDPASVLPGAVCETIHRASGGWPGIVDRLVLLALARATSCPLKPADIERPMVPPMTGSPGLQAISNVRSFGKDFAKLFLTYNGKTIKEIPFDRPRILVGRSEHNDLPIESRFISRHHAMFIRDGRTTVLMDLNSTNGTFVNSQRISNHVMVNDDVVMIGHHGLKFVDPNARESVPLNGESFNETVIMRSLEDLRRMLARENTELIDVSDEERQAAE